MTAKQVALIVGIGSSLATVLGFYMATVSMGVQFGETRNQILNNTKLSVDNRNMLREYADNSNARITLLECDMAVVKSRAIVNENRSVNNREQLTGVQRKTQTLALQLPTTRASPEILDPNFETEKAN